MQSQVLRQRHVRQGNHIDDGLMGTLVAAWRTSIREGDRAMARQLLSLAVTAKKFKQRHRHKFDDIIPKVVGSEVFITNPKQLRRNWCPNSDMSTPHGEIIGVGPRTTIRVKYDLGAHMHTPTPTRSSPCPFSRTQARSTKPQGVLCMQPPCG